MYFYESLILKNVYISVYIEKYKLLSINKSYIYINILVFLLLINKYRTFIPKIRLIQYYFHVILK